MNFAKTELVVKSNRLIEASYRLTLTEQRILLYAISRSREEQLGLFPELPITITAKNFMKQFAGVDEGSVYGQLKEAMDTLYERSVKIHDIDPETGLHRVRTTRWISEKAYIDGAGNIQLVFTTEVIKYIHRLEIEFTSYHLDKVGNMTSANAVRMYEMLAQHRDIGNRTINLAWLREKLQIEPGDYKLTADLKRWVIEPAVAQINKHSDLKVSYKSVKTGRSITDFVFKIKEKDATAKAPRLTKPRTPAKTAGQGTIPGFEDNGEAF